MSSLKSNFAELCEKIQRGREFGHASFEPIYYLIFDPSEILEVKRQTPAWISKLQNDFNWKVTTFSITDEIESVLKKDPRWSMWSMIDKKNPQNWQSTNQSLANVLTKEDNELNRRLDELLTSLEKQPNALLLVTDLEALHPYLRIGVIEAHLQSKFRVPTVFLYPGTRAGKTSLKFLGFYPEDGNYRSVHVGG